MKVFVAITAAGEVAIFLDHAQAYAACQPGPTQSWHVPTPRVPPTEPVTFPHAKILPLDLKMPEQLITAPEELQQIVDSPATLNKPQSEQEASEFLTKGLFRLAFFQEENPRGHRHATLHALINLLSLTH